MKGNPTNVNRGLDCDVIVAEVRNLSHGNNDLQRFALTSDMIMTALGLGSQLCVATPTATVLHTVRSTALHS